jgi:transcriptional regulator of acetoin/glycerol metabolism
MLLGWLDRSERSTQLIATTDRPLLDLVDTGRFDARLFYRLNTVYLDLNA